VRFVLVHLAFLGACLGVAALMNWLIHPDTVYEIGPGKEFPTLEAAERVIDVEAARIWVSVGAFSSLIVATVWIWKRAFAWFWIPLTLIPLIGSCSVRSQPHGLSRTAVFARHAANVTAHRM
jgi:hypothetical protein